MFHAAFDDDAAGLVTSGPLTVAEAGSAESHPALLVEVVLISFGLADHATVFVLHLDSQGEFGHIEDNQLMVMLSTTSIGLDVHGLAFETVKLPADLALLGTLLLPSAQGTLMDFMQAVDLAETLATAALTVDVGYQPP